MARGSSENISAANCLIPLRSEAVPMTNSHPKKSVYPDPWSFRHIKAFGGGYGPALLLTEHRTVLSRVEETAAEVAARTAWLLAFG